MTNGRSITVVMDGPHAHDMVSENRIIVVRRRQERRAEAIRRAQRWDRALAELDEVGRSIEEACLHPWRRVGLTVSVDEMREEVRRWGLDLIDLEPRWWKRRLKLLEHYALSASIRIRRIEQELDAALAVLFGINALIYAFGALPDALRLDRRLQMTTWVLILLFALVFLIRCGVWGRLSNGTQNVLHDGIRTLRTGRHRRTVHNPRPLPDFHRRKEEASKGTAV